MLTLRVLELDPTVERSIKEHGQSAKKKGGYEAVGFVAANEEGGIGVATMPLNNHSSDPKHGFFVEPWEQFRAERTLKDQGYTIIGIYHSHPNSEALPSQTDHKLAWANHYVIIYSVVFDDLKAYWLVDGWLEPVEMRV